MSNVKPIQQPLSLVLKLKTSPKPPSSSLAPIGLPTTLLLSTVYDGDFDIYLDKFIDSSHQAFDLVLPNVENGPPTPVLEHRQEFHDFVRKNNIGPIPGTFFSAYPTMSVNDIQNC